MYILSVDILIYLCTFLSLEDIKSLCLTNRRFLGFYRTNTSFRRIKRIGTRILSLNIRNVLDGKVVDEDQVSFYKDGKLDGVKTKKKEDRLVIKTYSDGRLHGRYVDQDIHSKIEGRYWYDLEHGVWNYYKNNKLEFSQSWKKGVLEGCSTSYNIDGSVKLEQHYHKGLLLQ